MTVALADALERLTLVVQKIIEEKIVMTRGVIALGQDDETIRKRLSDLEKRFELLVKRLDSLVKRFDSLEDPHRGRDY